MIRSSGSPTIVLAGGGTGGHLFPGVATAEELARRAPGSRILLAATQRDAVSRHGVACDLETVPVQSPRTPKNRLLYPLFLGRLAAAVATSKRVFEEHRPHVVVGLGGYGSAAPVYAAWRLGLPVLLLEQNAVPGKATRLLSRLRATVAVSYAGLERRGVHGTIVQTGNPVRRAVLAARPAHAELGLVAGVPTLAIVGGSLGAVGMNARVSAAIPALVQATGGLDGDGRARFQVIHAAGTPAEAASLMAAYERFGVRAAVRPFFADMGAVWGTCDAVLCRAGGTTIAEISAIGRPAVFVPFPHATDDHQTENAKPLAEAGAATIVAEESLTPERVAATAGPLLADAAYRADRSSRALRLGRPEAASRVVDLILELAARRREAR
ncbi:MAG: undecaprenyldiphospho-muramoylpentapeptide beta-N-acetylglucosaminyltransferase [Planctomycetes bacterium]|nr:undecaprenyldiphospho-muramoylpentapeptide beta-N-acetylglucosaminyltransferase [Planctomycetota bacterium]